MNLLLERMSVATDVIEKAESLRNEIKHNLDNRDYIDSQYINNARENRRIPFKWYWLKIELEGYEIPTTIILYDFISQEEINKYQYDIQDMWGGFDTYNFSIKICLPSINETYDINEIIDYLTHELEHAYQFIKSGGKNKITKLYSWANNQSTDETPLEHNLKYLIYYFSNTEIDAKIQQAFVQLKMLNTVSMQDINKSKTISEFTTIDNELKKILANKKYKNDAINILNKYGFNGKSVLRMLRAKRTLFKNKLVKMIGFYFDSWANRLMEDYFYKPLRQHRGLLW